MNAVADCPKPTIAAIEGVAFGGGCELALACDYRIAGDTARFGQPEIKLGIIPGWGGTQRLTRLIGLSRATDMILTGRHVHAEEAFRIGLANSVVGAGEALAAATSLAESFSSAAPLAVKIAKATIQRGMAMPLADGLATEIDGFVSSFATNDAREGVTAFLEKRPPTFSGH
jgi:enoyl-CoA hydratase